MNNSAVGDEQEEYFRAISKTQNFDKQDRKVHEDNRQISGNSSGKYTFQQEYLEDYDFEADFEDGESVMTDNTLVAAVHDSYKKVLDPELRSTPSISYDDGATTDTGEIHDKRLTAKEEIRSLMGDDVFDNIHEIILRYRSVDDFEQDNDAQEEQMYAEIKDGVGGVKDGMNLAFKLDGIIFAELLCQKFKGTDLNIE